MVYEMNIKGADVSPDDYRHLQHDKVGMPQRKASGGIKYEQQFILSQGKVGICTAISVVQNVLKATGKRYSEDFQYLLQKKFVDKNWDEGSSVYSALYVAKKYGMLPIEYLPSIVTANPEIRYDEYVKRLQQIENDGSTFARLMTKMEFPIKGYAKVGLDDWSFTQGIDDSASGLLARYAIGKEWWTDKNGRTSWASKDIEPLRPPEVIVSGHAVTVSDFSIGMGQIANTWGKEWADDGSALFNMYDYMPTEAWIPYYDNIPPRVSLPESKTFRYLFTKSMKKGDENDDVRALQTALAIGKFMELPQPNEFGFYGSKTSVGVLKFQIAQGIPLSWYERYVMRGSVVGPKTLQALNNFFAV